MYIRLDRVHRAVPVILGGFALVAIGVLFAWDVLPGYFPARAHDVLAAVLHVIFEQPRLDDGVDRARLLAEAAVDALEEVDVVARGAAGWALERFPGSRATPAASCFWIGLAMRASSFRWR